MGAVALIDLAWLLILEPDVARIPVRTIADLENCEGTRVALCAGAPKRWATRVLPRRALTR